jgi:hypothetical protein
MVLAQYEVVIWKVPSWCTHGGSQAVLTVSDERNDLQCSILSPPDKNWNLTSSSCCLYVRLKLAQSLYLVPRSRLDCLLC